MPELPITFFEQHNTLELEMYQAQDACFGWKMSLVSEDIVQLTVHQMDSRPGHDRLLNESIFHRNFGVESILTENPNDLFDRFFSLEVSFGDRYFSIHNAVSRREFYQAVAEFQERALAENWVEQCDECSFSIRSHGNRQGHETCAITGELYPMRMLRIYSVLQETRYGCEFTTFHISLDYGLDDLDLDIETCAYCGSWAVRAVTTVVDFNTMQEARICGDCMNGAEWCVLDDHYVPYDYMSDDETCFACNESQNNPHRFINDWNYRPDLEFYPELPTNPERPLYIGLELEMSWPYWSSSNREDAFDWLERLSEQHDVLYVKSDSSVNDGFEVVTHPMEPKWALENFPFDFFQEAIDLGAYATHPTCGTHIHMSKAALTTAQMYKILQLHLKLPSFCGTVGGRGTNTTYASWMNTANIQENLKEISRRKGEAYGDAERYVPVNVRNEETIELRYMAGSIDPNEIRKNIEWVQALYEFTDYISIEDIKNGVLENQNYLLGWVMDGKYPSLAKFLEKKILIPTAMPERTV